MSINVYYTTPTGIDMRREFDDWMEARLFEKECRLGSCNNIRLIEGSNMGRWDSLMLDASRLVYRGNMSPMMAIAHLLQERGLSSRDASQVMSEITGKSVRPSCARDYMRRAAERASACPHDAED